MKSLVKYSFIYFFLFSNLQAGIHKKQNQEFFVLGCRENAGMFSIFQDVLSLLKSYEKSDVGGIEIDFDTKGLYYDEALGKNWWSYYFKPIKYGIKKNPVKITGEFKYSNPWEIEQNTSRKQVHKLIKKHIHVKKHISEKIKKFKKEKFSGCYVIGVHYRGTDKILEAPRVPYEEVAIAVKNIIKQKKLKKYKIFIATDELNFINYMKVLFLEHVCFRKNSIRSTDNIPIHMNEKFNKYQCGEDALIDCILLSKTDFLVRMSSNLSLCSTFFNPKLKSLELNKRF